MLISPHIPHTAMSGLAFTSIPSLSFMSISSSIYSSGASNQNGEANSPKYGLALDGLNEYLHNDFV